MGKEADDASEKLRRELEKDNNGDNNNIEEERIEEYLSKLESYEKETENEDLGSRAMVEERERKALRREHLLEQQKIANYNRALQKERDKTQAFINNAPLQDEYELLQLQLDKQRNFNLKKNPNNNQQSFKRKKFNMSFNKQKIQSSEFDVQEKVEQKEKEIKQEEIEFGGTRGGGVGGKGEEEIQMMVQQLKEGEQDAFEQNTGAFVEVSELEHKNSSHETNKLSLDQFEENQNANQVSYINDTTEFIKTVETQKDVQDKHQMV